MYLGYGAHGRERVVADFIDSHHSTQGVCLSPTPAILCRMWLNLSVWAAAVCAAILVGCSGGGAGGGSSGGPTTPSLLVDFVRNTAPADGSFKVVYWQSSASAAVQAFSSLPLVNATRGLVSASVLRSDGKREVTVTPGAQKTGEYSVTLNCILSGNPSSAFCQSPLGPVVAPQRPHMPGASRVGINTVHHGCPSLNFDSSPVPVPPIAMYGFRRQVAGSYAEPFVFAFNGGDGCVAPWGPTVRANGDGSYRMFTAFNDPRNAGTAITFVF